MSITIDRSAFLEATEAYWKAETGTDKGLEAFLETYLDRVGLSSTHEAFIVFRREFKAQMAEFAARRDKQMAVL